MYFLACFHHAHTNHIPVWAYLGHWDMFTVPGKYNKILRAEVRRNGVWHEIDLDALFPYQWGSGPRYARGSFRRSRGRMRILAGSVCHRLDATPEKVRLIQVKWRKTLGSVEQPRVKAREKTLLEWRCGTKITLPNGRTL